MNNFEVAGIVIISMFCIIMIKPLLSEPWINRVDSLKNLVLQAHPQKIIDKATLLPDDLLDYALSMQSSLKRKEKLTLCERVYKQRDWDNEIHVFPKLSEELKQRKTFLLNSINIYQSRQFEWLCFQRAYGEIKNYIAHGYPIHAVLKKYATEFSAQYEYLTYIIDKNNFSLITSKKRLNKTLFSIKPTNLSLLGNPFNLIQRLLNAGANVNAINTQGKNFFYQLFTNVALTHSEPIAPEIISFFDLLLKEYNASIDSACSTGMLKEIGYAHPHALQYLVDNGINILKNCVECNGPLISPVVSIFGKNNLMANVSNWRKTKKIYLDKIKKIEKFPELLDKNKEGKTILHVIIERWAGYFGCCHDNKRLLDDRKEIVKTLLSKGSLLTSKDNTDVTTSVLLLKWALRENNLLEIKTIVEECAQPSCKTLFKQDLDEYSAKMNRLIR